jgi:hypothetical protein
MPLNDLARARLEAERLARLEAERPFNPGSTGPAINYRIRPTPDYSTPEYANAKAAWFANPRNEGRIYKKEYAFNDPGEPNTIFLDPRENDRISNPTLRPPTPPDFMDEARRNAMADYYQRMGINPGRPMDGSSPSFSPIGGEMANYYQRTPDASLPPYPVSPPSPINPLPPDFMEQARRNAMADYYQRVALTPVGQWNPDGTLPPVGGEVAADPEPEEYDGFVDGGTGQRGFLDFKYMPTPMAQAAPVTMAQAAPVAMASTAYNAPPVASTAYMPPPTAESASTAYMPPPTDAPVNTAYMPSRRTVPVDTTYRPPAQANTTYMPSSAPTYGMSSTPSYGMSNAQTTTPTYGGQIREPSYSPNQAGKYKVDGPRLRNTGGLFNDLNAFFGRPQT